MIERRLFACLAASAGALSLVGVAARAGAEPAFAAAGPALPVRGARVTSRAESPVVAQASALPEPSAEPEPTGIPASMPSPETAARARAVFEENRAGRIDRAHYTARENARISEAALADAAAMLTKLGAVKSFTQVRKITHGTFVAYVFLIECERQPAVEQFIAWNAAGQVDFLQFAPADR